MKQYVDTSLRSPSASALLVMNDMEATCWQLSESSYQSEALNSSELKKMWYIFNRMPSQHKRKTGSVLHKLPHTAPLAEL